VSAALQPQIDQENEEVPSEFLSSEQSEDDVNLIVDMLQQEIDSRTLKLPYQCSFDFGAIKFNAEITPSEIDNQYVLALKSSLGVLPFSSENRPRRMKILSLLNNRTLSADCHLEAKNAISYTAKTAFADDLTAKNIMNALIITLIDCQDKIKKVLSQFD